MPVITYIDITIALSFIGGVIGCLMKAFGFKYASIVILVNACLFFGTILLILMEIYIHRVMKS